MDGRRAAWDAALKAAGHTPLLTEDGDLDVLVCEPGTHNGPGCAVCDWSCCWGCRTIEEIPACTGPEAVTIEVKMTVLEMDTAARPGELWKKVSDGSWIKI